MRRSHVTTLEEVVMWSVLVDMQWYNQRGSVKQRLRESIASHDSVKCLFGVFYIEDRSGKVTLDQFKALEHVRHVLNEVHRTSKPRKAMQMVNF